MIGKVVAEKKREIKIKELDEPIYIVEKRDKVIDQLTVVQQMGDQTITYYVTDCKWQEDWPVTKVRSFGQDIYYKDPQKHLLMFQGKIVKKTTKKKKAK
jgi:hypothetical protein